MNYLKKNFQYWNFDYSSLNVESVIFRFVGLLEKFFHIKEKSSFLDFGCGQGASVKYLIKKGYSAVGVDMSKKNIEIGKKYFKTKKLYTVPPESFNCDFTKYNKNKKFSIIMCQQSIYYFNEGDFKKILKNFYNCLEKNGILYFSVISVKHSLYKNSIKTKDSWLRGSKYEYKKQKSLSYVFFIKDPKKFYKKYLNEFKLINIGEYYMQLTDRTTNNHHYTFLLKK